MFPEGSKAADYIAAYRTWLGIEPYPQLPIRKKPKAKEDDLVVGKKVDLVALAVKGNTVSCRILGTDRVLTLRPSGFFEGVPGEIITVMPGRMWRYAGHPYLAGEIKDWRLDIPALGLTPLGLKEMGVWDPKDHYWGEPDEPIEPWARADHQKGSETRIRDGAGAPGRGSRQPRY